MAKITKIQAMQILDSRDTPTVSATVFLDDGTEAAAAVPSGASTGSHEAFELRDGNAAEYGGKSVHRAVANIENVLGPKLAGMDAGEQTAIDEAMIALDGTENKQNLGANAILAVSLAVARAAAASRKLELYEHLHLLGPNPTQPLKMPFAMFNIINGGVHARGSSDFQEYMVVPIQTGTFAKRLQCASEIFQALKQILTDAGLPTTVGDEGGFAPQVSSDSQALDLILQAAEKAGYKPGIDASLAIDLAASQFFKDGKYNLAKEGKSFSSAEMINYCKNLAEKYPIISLEDPLEENDFAGFAELTRQISALSQTVGDDLYTTNLKRLQTGIAQKSTTAILIKLNQIGTLTETIRVMELAQKAGLKTVVSHRSGETEDAFEADFAVAMNSEQVKFGSLTRSERLAKYNRLLAIEEQINIH